MGMEFVIKGTMQVAEHVMSYIIHLSYFSEEILISP